MPNENPYWTPKERALVHLRQILEEARDVADQHDIQFTAVWAPTLEEGDEAHYSVSATIGFLDVLSQVVGRMQVDYHTKNRLIKGNG